MTDFALLAEDLAQIRADLQPLLESIIAPTTTAMVDFETRVVGWKTDAQYNALSYDVNSEWDGHSRSLRHGTVTDLRQAVANIAPAIARQPLK